MAPPKVTDIGTSAEASETPSAVLLCLSVDMLKNRADFLRTAQGRRQGTGGFLLQGRAREDVPKLSGPALVRVGFTASKKIGNAVARNRAKRRLRAIVREVLAQFARPGWDYVLVAKPGATILRPYSDLLTDLQTALRSVHKDRP